MNNKFDELTKGLAQSVTRRKALMKFGIGLAGMAWAAFGLVNKAQADIVAAKPGSPGGLGCFPSGFLCYSNAQCCSGVCYKVNTFYKRCR